MSGCLPYRIYRYGTWRIEVRHLKQNTVTLRIRKISVFIAVMMSVLFVSPIDAGVPVPDIPKALKGKQCVEETSFMRRNHMDLLMHQRDKTMHKGIRTKQHSLVGCLSCHAVIDVDGQAVSIKSDKHFCNSCHSYAAVKIDCFECHASTPPKQVSLKGDSL